MKHYDDERLVQLFLVGSSEAFDTLVTRYRSNVQNYVVTIVGQRSVAEDVVQETFIKVIEQLKQGKYSESGKFSAWLMRVAHNVAIDYYRKQRNHLEVTGAAYDYDLLKRAAERGADLERFEMEEKDKTTLRSLICKLPEEQCQVLVLRFYMDLSFKEIAEHLDIGINTALGRMRYAISNLQKMMEKEDQSAQSVRAAS